ncbi:MAG: cytochrome c [Gemmatimonadota bacterium]|nr:cytochrome c [Gemmatimonadota bacterium]
MKPTRAIALLAVMLAAGMTGCDDQVKRVPWFRTMNRQASVETYEAVAMLPPEGSVPLGAAMHYDLLAADTLLTNPVAGGADAIERGRILYAQFCVMCHGATGAGDGTVVGPGRLPPLPTLNLLSERAMALSDGYMWGMVANGRGVMPSYRRIPAGDRWYLVHYVRELQGASAPPADAVAAE